MDTGNPPPITAPITTLITSPAALDAGLDALVAIDGRFAPLAARARPLPMRAAQPGFAAFTRVVIAQQVSAAVAAVLSARLSAAAGELTPQRWFELGEEGWRAAGLSRPKQKTISAVARAVLDDGLDLVAACRLPAGEAVGRLTALWGVGPWTAEVYLLFAGGHPDIFPARDLALQVAADEAFGLGGRPAPEALERMALDWAPWRSVAARLLWAVYGLDRGNAQVEPA